MSSKTASPTKEKFTSSARPLKCKFCWRRFKYRDCLTDHMRRDHLETILNSIIERKKAQMNHESGMLVIEQDEIEAELDERKPIRVSVIKRLPY